MATEASRFHLDPADDNEKGQLGTNVAMFIGAKHASDLHPAGYWTGDGVYFQLNHAIAVFDFIHPD